MHFDNLSVFKQMQENNKQDLTGSSLEVSNKDDDFDELGNLLKSGHYPFDFTIEFGTERLTDERIQLLVNGLDISTGLPGLTLSFRGKNLDEISIQPVAAVLATGQLPYGSTLCFWDTNLVDADLTYLADVLVSSTCPKWLTIELYQKNVHSEGMRISKATSKSIDYLISQLKVNCPIGLVLTLPNIGTDEQKREIKKICHASMTASLPHLEAYRVSTSLSFAPKALQIFGTKISDFLREVDKDNITTICNQLFEQISKLMSGKNSGIINTLQLLSNILLARKNDLIANKGYDQFPTNSLMVSKDDRICTWYTAIPTNIELARVISVELLKRKGYLSIGDIVQAWQSSSIGSGPTQYAIISQPRRMLSWRSGPRSAQVFIDNLMLDYGDLESINLEGHRSLDVQTVSTSSGSNYSPRFYQDSPVQLDMAADEGHYSSVRMELVAN